MSVPQRVRYDIRRQILLNKVYGRSFLYAITAAQGVVDGYDSLQAARLAVRFDDRYQRLAGRERQWSSNSQLFDKLRGEIFKHAIEACRKIVAVDGATSRRFTYLPSASRAVHYSDLYNWAIKWLR